MKKLFLRSLLPVVFSVLAHAQGLSTGGGMDSGGGTGLPYRLKNAVSLSIQVLANVLPEDLKLIRTDVYEFYVRHRTELILESATADLRVVPASEVFVEINGVRHPRPMSTRLSPGATISVADTLTVTNPAELTQNLLHEYGHHLGVPQENDAFLDQLSLILVMKAMEKGVEFHPPVSKCISSDELLYRMAGKWKGTVHFGSSMKPWMARIDISPSGVYIDSTECFAGEASCPSAAFFYGIPGADARKKIVVQSVCGGDGNGKVDVVFAVGTVRTFELSLIKISLDWNELSFDMVVPQTPSPVHFDLIRL